MGTKHTQITCTLTQVRTRLWGMATERTKMNKPSKSLTLENLYYVLYETAQNHADNAATDDEARTIRKEASKFLAKVQKLQKASA